MIKAINLINCTPYKEAALLDCKKVNYVFGANGSGKSTISSYLGGVSDPRFWNSTIEWMDQFMSLTVLYN